MGYIAAKAIRHTNGTVYALGDKLPEDLAGLPKFVRARRVFFVPDDSEKEFIELMKAGRRPSALVRKYGKDSHPLHVARMLRRGRSKPGAGAKPSPAPAPPAEETKPEKASPLDGLKRLAKAKPKPVVMDDDKTPTEPKVTKKKKAKKKTPTSEG